ncbi:hypothetical protein GUJ93_ZPchr0010g9042 [Zizania palustris]|uniref:Uncharacterized protein n=1 Tax=Zizania palustris TaxID=103762 RepID=A0A8J5W845_ZIZPA|nr:hypothetical protein GUJ93_ZPchr0010g9042 [Zizania palustris]
MLLGSPHAPSRRTRRRLTGSPPFATSPRFGVDSGLVCASVWPSSLARDDSSSLAASCSRAPSALCGSALWSPARLSPPDCYCSRTLAPCAQAPALAILTMSSNPGTSSK